ncbi:MAG: hypothetical protein ACON39_03940 [Coraliomargaritaceae bacterium]
MKYFIRGKRANECCPKDDFSEGFALVVGLLLAGLLTAVGLGFSTLVRVQVEEARQMRGTIEAREGARLALHLALGQLQRMAGPDQRVTGSAGLLGGAVGPSARTWVGVWNTAEPEAAPVWLVSGRRPDLLATTEPMVPLLEGFDHGGGRTMGEPFGWAAGAGAAHGDCA